MSEAKLGKITNMKEYEQIACRAKCLANICSVLDNDSYWRQCMEEYETRLKNGEELSTYEVADYEEMLVRKAVTAEAQTAIMKLLSK